MKLLIRITGDDYIPHLDFIKFDAEFRKELEKEFTEEEFKGYVRNCKLTKQRADELIDALWTIKN